MILRLTATLLAAAALAAAPPAAGQSHSAKFQPGSNYICPNNTDSGLDCYLDAVVHLYTMCRHVKSIEIIEFGLPAAQEGVNGAKSEYCVDKQKINIVRPYQAALKEATPWRDVVENLRHLQQFWLDAMVALKWDSKESRESYEDRVIQVYDDLSWKIDAVRVAYTTAPEAAAAAVAATPKARPKAKTAAKAN
ncbi:MAG: hypothetical protein IPM22_16130 [Betaproteobacteria bacterium]|nr:hypothetical protein [Betaproteobacteria bacterium]MCC7215726.1 hypothetical protein [Burkholderiales bacterium]